MLSDIRTTIFFTKMILLIIFIFLSAITYIVGDFLNKPLVKYFSKPITTILIILLAVLQQVEVSETYKYLIIIALVFSLVGDVFLMLPTDKFIQGLISFLVAHIFYIVAFTLGFGPYFEFSLLVPAAIYAVIFLWILLPKTGKMKPAVIIYSLTLMVFLWQATGRFYYIAETTALLTLFGAILFIISDTILAYSRFLKKYKFSQTLIHLTYWGAQVLLALSI